MCGRKCTPVSDTTVSTLSTEVAPNPSAFGLSAADVEQQMTAARRWPRDVQAARRSIQTIALSSEDTAASCLYALPRQDRERGSVSIEGPSVRFAEIIQYSFEHLFTMGKTVDETDRYVVAQGGVWDMQKNNRRIFEVRRRIVNNKGRRYSDDMIATTANAASAIALRNAVLGVIPAALWRDIWMECKRVAVGDQTTLNKRRRDMVDYFQKAGIHPVRVFATLGIQTEADITLEMLGTLRGVATAIKDGDVSLDEAFPEVPAGYGVVQMPSPVAPPVQAPVPVAPPVPVAQPAPIVTPPAPIVTPAEEPHRHPDAVLHPFAPGAHIDRVEPKEREGKSTVYAVRFSDHPQVYLTFSTTLGPQLVAMHERGARLASAVVRQQGTYHYVEAVTEARA